MCLQPLVMVLSSMRMSEMHMWQTSQVCQDSLEMTSCVTYTLWRNGSLPSRYGWALASNFLNFSMRSVATSGHLHSMFFHSTLQYIIIIYICFSLYYRKQAIDEGGMPLFAIVLDKSYIPGKPHPNCVEYIIAVGEDMWACNIIWRRDTRPKEGFPEAKLDQMKIFIDYFKNIFHPSSQPFIFYIDARWSSLPLMQAIHNAHFYCVLSCSVKMRPQRLLAWMRDGLAVKDHWSVGYTPCQANLVTIRTKKKVYLNLLTNWASLHPVNTVYHKRKYPGGEYTLQVPWAQKEYNIGKAKVDQWNKAILEYFRHPRYTDNDSMYTQFFIHAWVLQSYHLYKASTQSDISQLDYRKRLLEELLPLCSLRDTAKALGSTPQCWPSLQKGQRSSCQYPPCRNSCSYYCYSCKKWGCLSCISKAHGH